jgi:hypothetical protein
MVVMALLGSDLRGYEAAYSTSRREAMGTAA